jgi:2-phosphoglycerate kinase
LNRLAILRDHRYAIFRSRLLFPLRRASRQAETKMSDMNDEPLMVLIGGPNGAGKTTLASRLLPTLGLGQFVNADNIAR